MRIFSKLRLLGFVSLVIAANAYADVSFHGYGQIVAGTVFSNNRTFPGESQGYSYHADPTFTPNSNFALQATAPLDNNISATAQILTRGDDDFQPKFQWAYLRYQLSNAVALKAGRLQTPFYQYSDYQFVGEAYPWVVLPEAVYFSQITTYDGLNLSAEKSVGDWYLYMQAIYGSADQTVATATPTASGPVTVNDYVHVHNLTGLSVDSSYNDWLNLRAAAFFEDLTIAGDSNPANPFAAVQGVVDSLYPNNPDAAKAFDSSNDPTLYYVASAQVSRNNWLLLAEYQGLQHIAGSSGVTPDSASEYVSFGYHFGKLLPLVTVGHRNQWIRADKMKSAIPASSPPVTVPVQFNGITIPVDADTFIDGIAGNPEIRAKDYFYDFSLRYDLTPTVALKLDYTFYQSHYKTSDYPIAAASGTPSPPDANRLLAAVTFSF